jgi:hypothetical protein
LPVAGSLQGQRIEKVTGSRYETEATVVELDPLDFENFSFTSSSYIGGDLRLVNGGGSETKISYRKVLKAASKEQAEDFANYLNLQVEELENELSVAALTESRPPWSGTNFSGRLDIQIELPDNPDLRIYVRTDAYYISVTGPFAAVDISNEFGAVEVSDILSKVKVTTETGSIKVEDCTGPVTVRTSARPIVIANVDSKLGTIKLRNSHGLISLDQVKGELDVRTEFAPIKAQEISLESGRSRLRTESSNITLEALEVSGDLTLINRHGKIDLVLPETASANFNLRVDEGGRIYTTGIPIEVDLVKRVMLTGKSGDGQHEIDIDMRGVGTISLQGLPRDEI